VELFDKYAVDCRGNFQLFDEMKGASQAVVDGVSTILLKRKRQSLSKKFPQRLFVNASDIFKGGESLSK